MKSTFPRKLPQPISVVRLVEMVGDAVVADNVENKEVLSIASPSEAEDGSLVFCNKTDESQAQKVIQDTKATVIVAAVKVPVRPGQGLIVAEDPLAWFIRALNIVFKDTSDAAIHPSVSIDSRSRVGNRVEIGMGTAIDRDCQIGDNCRIGSHCYLGPGTVLGDGCFVQNNVTVGSVGLGYHFTAEDERLFFPHLGCVLIGTDAVVGSGSVIVRGELEDTMIGDRTRLGNLVNVGHNVRIGSDCAVSSGTCIAGGVRIDERCNIAVGVSINAKVRVGHDCQIGLGSVVTKNIAPGISVFGVPAAPIRTMRRF